MLAARDLELADQLFQGALERAEYDKALRAVVHCKQICAAHFHSDLCTERDFHKYHDMWEYYREMEDEIRQLAKAERRKERGGFFSRLFG